MNAPLAVVTMVYNEADLLPVWRRHYAAQLGEAHCHVIDHGSDDGSTDSLGRINCMRLPRSPQDDTRRTSFLWEFCAALLRWYDAVIYVDVDELLVADPLRFASLLDYARSVPDGSVRTAIGLDVIHAIDAGPPAACTLAEPPMDWQRPVSAQRSLVRFSSAMCKPVLIRRPVNWAPGFHCIDQAPAFDDLYLFHLRYADLPAGLSRLARTRAQPWANPQAGMHQRMPDTQWAEMLGNMAALPARNDLAFGPDDPVLAEILEQVTESAETRSNELYRLDLHISGHELWRLPPRFIGTF